MPGFFCRTEQDGDTLSRALCPEAGERQQSTLFFLNRREPRQPVRYLQVLKSLDCVDAELGILIAKCGREAQSWGLSRQVACWRMAERAAERLLKGSRENRDTIRIYTVRYEWDEAKNRRNQQIHDGISFEVASLAFEDKYCLIVPDRIDGRTGEQRWQALGEARPRPDMAAVLLVVHVYRENIHGEETIRIISARGAEKDEIRRYREQALE